MFSDATTVEYMYFNVPENIAFILSIIYNTFPGTNFNWPSQIFGSQVWPLVLMFNSLAPEGFEYSLKLINFKLISTINILSIFCEIAIRWMPQHLTDHWSTLVQLMAWCRQATSHYLSQCWPRPCRHMASLGHIELNNEYTQICPYPGIFWQADINHGL